MKKTPPAPEKSAFELSRQHITNCGDNLYRNTSTGIYMAIFTVRGKQIRRTLNTTDRDLAKRNLESLRQQVGRIVATDGKGLAFAEYNETEELIGGLAKRWLDIRSLKDTSRTRRLVTIKALAAELKGKTASSITSDDVDRAMAAQAGSARNWNMIYETLDGCLRFAADRGMRIDNPASHLKRRPPTTKKMIIPNREQFKNFLAAMRSVKGNEHSAFLCEFLAYCGCRISEATGDVHGDETKLAERFKWGDVDYQRGIMTLTGKGTEGGKTRYVPLFAPLLRLFETQKAALPVPPADGDYVFHILNPKKAIDAACKRAKLPHYTNHTMRHFFCSNAIEAGADFKVIADWLGHSDGGILVAKTYGHLRPEHSKAMAAKITFDASLN